jgi:hypothetical protein
MLSYRTWPNFRSAESWTDGFPGLGSTVSMSQELPAQSNKSKRGPEFIASLEARRDLLRRFGHRDVDDWYSAPSRERVCQRRLRFDGPTGVCMY